MQDVRDVAEIAKNEYVQLNNGNIFKQKATKQIQDLMDLNAIKLETLDFSPWGNYKLQFVLTIGQSQIEINHYNDNINEEYRFFL